MGMSAALNLGWPRLGLILPAGPEPERGGEPDQDERGGDESGSSREQHEVDRAHSAVPEQPDRGDEPERRHDDGHVPAS